MRINRTLLTVLSAVTLNFTSAVAADKPAAPAWPPFPPPVTTAAPNGVFRYLRLQLDQVRSSGPSEIHLIARDERIVQASLPGVTYPVFDDLKLTDTTLCGKLSADLFPGGANGWERFIYEFDLKLTPTGIAGKYTLNPVAGDKYAAAGAVTGECLTAAQMAKANALAKGRDWPGFAGPGSDFNATPTGQALVADHTKARLLWRSEALLPHGPGSASRSTPGRTVGVLRGSSSYTLVGGSASPVVADGRVIQVVHEASEKELAIPGLDSDEGYIIDATSGQPLSARTEYRNLTANAIPLGSWEKCTERYGPAWTAMEKRRWSLHADDIVVAVDAATGGTLWRTVLPQRSFNFTDHKNHYCGHTPVVIGNVVVAVGGSRRCYGLEAATGKVLWEIELPGWPQAAELMVGKLREKWTRMDGQNLASAAGIALVPSYAGSLLGIDPATGKVLWEVPGTGNCSRLVAGGKELVFDGQNAIEPVTGKILWTLPEPAKQWAVKGDQLAVARNSRDGQPHPAGLTLYKVSSEAAQPVWTQPKMPCHRMIIAGDSICALVLTSKGNELELISLTDGATLWAPGIVRPPPAIYPNHANAPGLAGVEDRLLINYDSAHGAINMAMLRPAGKETKFLSYSDGLPMNMTGPYNGGFWAFTVADGRMFVRGSDGIYCFDLRTETK